MLLLDELQTRGRLTLTELAASTGLHRNTAREHLQVLVGTGLVRAEPDLRGRRGRPELIYRMASAPDDVERRDRRRDAESRTGGRTRPGAPSTARSRDAALQLDVLADHLVQSGFDATIRLGAGCLTLRDCPFERLSEREPRVCEVHRALIEDALRLAEGPVAAGELHRHSGEHECTLELTLATDDRMTTRP